MILKETAFILGAGASTDFGFPIGEELRKTIIKNLRDTTNPYHREELAQTLTASSDISDFKKKVIAFANDLEEDHARSIDDFLERHKTQYLKLGKLAIAQIIARRERHNALFAGNNWYQILGNKMKEGATIETLSDNKVSFITFNYDRSLEHYLYTTFSKYHEQISLPHVRGIMNKIPIIHLYGQLDPLPWQTTSDTQGRPYEPDYTKEQFNNYSNHIDIIFENINNEIQERFNQAKEILKKAEIIYILGFGFHQINLERLKLQELKGKKTIATIFGMANRKEIENLIGKIENGKMKLSECKVYDLARQNEFLNY